MRIHYVADARIAAAVRRIGLAGNHIFVDRRINDVGHIYEILARRVVDVDEVIIVDVFGENYVLSPG